MRPKPVGRNAAVSSAGCSSLEPGVGLIVSLFWDARMPAGHGLRSRTRDLFSKGYRKNGVVPLTDTLRVFKIGDYVDIKVNSAVHAGMPFKWYHGKTGIIWNVTKRALGVEVNKQVRRYHVCIALTTLPSNAFLCKLCTSDCGAQSSNQGTASFLNSRNAFVSKYGSVLSVGIVLQWGIKPAWCWTRQDELLIEHDNMQVNGRIIRKRIHVRVEHIVPSRCREDFLKRRTEHEILKKEAKAKGGAYPKRENP
jgi:ribosomal protein L21E